MYHTLPGFLFVHEIRGTAFCPTGMLPALLLDRSDEEYRRPGICAALVPLDAMVRSMLVVVGLALYVCTHDRVYSFVHRRSEGGLVANTCMAAHALEREMPDLHGEQLCLMFTLKSAHQRSRNPSARTNIAFPPLLRDVSVQRTRLLCPGVDGLLSPCRCQNSGILWSTCELSLHKISVLQKYCDGSVSACRGCLEM